MPESQDGAGSLNITWSYSNGSEHQGKIDLSLLRKSSYSLATSSTPPSTVSIASNLVSHYQWWIQVCAWCIQAYLFMNCLSAERLVHRISSMDKWCEISYTVRCCLHPAKSIYNNAFLHVLEFWMVKTESTGPILEAISLKLVSPRTNQNYIYSLHFAVKAVRN